MNHVNRRYHGIAVGLHWVIAALILGTLALGNYMVSLDESDPLRFVLTQWHKSFGVVVLFLVVGRILWRAFNTPPPLPEDLQRWEKLAAGTAHILLYLLMLVIPVSGWIMVSASPLEIPTLLFNGIPWPHLPPFDTLSNKLEISEWFLEVHTIAGWVLSALLLGHIGAAMRHRFVLHDDVMSRMSPRGPDGRWVGGFVPLSGAVVLGVVGLIAVGYVRYEAAPMVIGNNRVTFTFLVQGREVEGTFAESTVELSIDPGNPASNALRAAVNTTAPVTGNSQVDTTLKGSDWFDAGNHPQASFKSSTLTPVGADRYVVDGILQIKSVSRNVSFPMTLESDGDRRIASGSFSVSRKDFDLGTRSQPSDSNVGYGVVIEFEFEIH